MPHGKKRAILKCSLPIFVKLVYAEVCRWKSYTPEKDMTLTTTVVESIMNFIEKVEIQHGRILVSHAFAYITASKSGLSEIELEDLISLDDTILEDVYQYHLPPVRRIPPLLWTRIRNDIPSYLSEREADGITVLNWYHRQFRSAAMARYLDNESSLCFFHSSIADYFLGTWGGGKKKPFKFSELQKMRFGLCTSDGEADRKVPLQPLVFESKEDSRGKTMSGTRYNMRKMSELPFHLIRANRGGDLLSEVLFNYNWLYYKLSSFPISAVLADFEDAKENLCDKKKDTFRELTLIVDSLRLGRSVLLDYPQMVGPQITGRLLPVKENYKNIKSLINQCDQIGTKNCGLVPAYHCLHTPGGPMKYSLEGHPFAVFGFCLTSDSKYVISVSNRFIICDVTTSDITQDIDPLIEGIMMDVQISEDDKYAVAYTNYNLILLLNVLNGDVQKVSLTETEKEGFLTGISVGHSAFCAWSNTRYFFFKTNTGDILEEHVIQEKYAFVVSVYIDTLNNYNIIINIPNATTGKCYQLLKTVKEGNTVSSFSVYGALTFNTQRSKAYLVDKDKELDEVYNISLYVKSNDEWSFRETVAKDVPQILSLSLDDKQGLLCGVLVAKFMIWSLQNGTEVSYCLPDTVLNISTRPLQSQSSMVITQNNQFVVGAVRKQLYIWDMKRGQMLRILDAHFGRILRMRILNLEDFNGFATASLDRSLKVWNVRNLFEDSHVIDRMDMAVESITMDRKSTIGVTMTRSSIGVWDLMTGKLMARLSDSQVGAIITHALITADGRFIPCIESGLYIVWSVENRSVLCRERESNVKNVSLISRDTRTLILSQEDVYQAKITCRSVPDGGIVFCLSFRVMVLRQPVVTANGKFLVVSTFDKGQECLAMYNPRKGEHLHNFAISKDEVKSFKCLIPMPSTSPVIGLLQDYKAVVVDVSSRKILKIINKWNGVFSRNGKLGLYAPTEGGLNILELRRGKPVKTLLNQMAEGIFSVKAFFSANNKYVIYYHSGRNSIRVFRVRDGKMIANYKLSSEIHSVDGTPDGLGIVVGGADGTLTLLSIVDADDPGTVRKLSELPSRMEVGETEGNISVTFKSTAQQIMRVSLPLKSKETNMAPEDNS